MRKVCLAYHGIPGPIDVHAGVTLGNLYKALRIDQHVYQNFLTLKKVPSMWNDRLLFPLIRVQEFMHLDQGIFTFIDSPEGFTKVWVTAGIGNVPALLALKAFILGCTKTHSPYFPVSCVLFGRLTHDAEEFFTRIGLNFSMFDHTKESVDHTLLHHFPVLHTTLLAERKMVQASHH
ncbi:MAG: hypothetical protein WCG05_03000 [Alphaproteobacteria bacterium]